MYPTVTSVQATDDHKLVLEFNNSEQRVFDMQPILGFGRFSEFKNIDEFKKVHIAFDSIEWSNELDLDPEYLYDKSEPINAELKEGVRGHWDQPLKIRNKTTEMHDYFL